MINRKYPNWDWDKDLEMLAFFASLVDEMTFNYTIDSFKAPAMNTYSLLEEALSTLKQVNCGEIKEGAMTSILEEATYAVQCDKIFVDVLRKLNLNYLIEGVDFRNISKSDLYDILELLMMHPTLTIDYTNNLISVLTEEIKNGRRKSDIESYTRLLITQLKNIGYSDEYIYHTTIDYFYSGKYVISNLSAIDDYWSKFNCEDRHFTLYFVANQLLNSLGENNCLKVVEINEIPGDTKPVEIFKRRIQGSNIVLSLDVLSKDCFSARRKAIETVCENLYILNLYHHKYQLFVSSYCLAIDKESKDTFFLKNTTPPIHKCTDQRVHQALQTFKQKQKDLCKTTNSYKRIINALKLHDSALKSDIVENQYINLFTALEVLIPKDIKADKDRIVQIFDTTIPYLCVNYYKKLLDSLLLDLFIWNKAFVTGLLTQVAEGHNNVEKLAALITLSKYDGDDDKDENGGPAPTVKELNMLYNKLNDDKFFLMRYRLNRLYKIFKSKKAICEFMTRHEERIKWHIDRIYRLRNGIVHAGVTARYTSSVIENLHAYVDILLKQLIEDNIVNHFDELRFSFTTYSYRFKNYKMIFQNQSKKEEDSTVSMSSDFLKLLFID